MLLLAMALSWAAFARAAAPARNVGQFTVTCLQVADSTRGLGLAIILQTPSGHTYLYDTGAGYPSTTDPSGWVAGVNTARDQIAPFLEVNHITAIDGVIISHAHLDHYGGLLWLVDHFPIKKLYDTGYEYTGPMPPNYADELAGYSKLRQRFKDRHAYQEVHAGDHLDLDPELEIEALAPPRGYFHEAHPEERPAADPPAHYLLNANSTDLRIRHGKVVFLFPGDIQKEDIDRNLLPFVPPAKLRATSSSLRDTATIARCLQNLLKPYVRRSSSPAFFPAFSGAIAPTRSTEPSALMSTSPPKTAGFASSPMASTTQ